MLPSCHTAVVAAAAAYAAARHSGLESVCEHDPSLRSDGDSDSHGHVHALRDYRSHLVTAAAGTHYHYALAAQTNRLGSRGGAEERWYGKAVPLVVGGCDRERGRVAGEDCLDPFRAVY